MNKEEAIKTLKGEAWICCSEKWNEALAMAIKALEQNESAEEWYKLFVEKLEQEPSGDLISREPFTDSTICEGFSCDECSFNRKDKGGCILEERVMNLPSVKQEPKTGRWSRKTKVDAYDIAGVKTWGIKCQCDRCDFTTIVVEDFGYYKYCPNCGAKMVEPQESEDKE